MKLTIFLLLVVVVVAVIAALMSKQTLRGGKGAFGKKRFVTPNEQSMFWRLVEAFPAPEFVVLAQVSFGALLTAKGGASRYSFSQKIADFVITDKSFTVLAVIELDDASHRGKEDKDTQRDAMLSQAGYRVLRYPKIPSTDTLKADFAPPPPPAPKRSPVPAKS